MANAKVETRTYGNVVLRAAGDKADESRRIEGHAAVFGSETELWPGEFEQIQAGAFARTLKAKADVRALFNHDPNMILARTASGTLAVSEDKEGLWYGFDAPNTTAGNDVLESIRRGDVTQSSFAFSVPEGGEIFETKKDGSVLRTVVDANLFDVSPVTYPAYQDTDVGARESAAKVAFRNAPSATPEPESEEAPAMPEDSSTASAIAYPMVAPEDAPDPIVRAVEAFNAAYSAALDDTNENRESEEPDGDGPVSQPDDSGDGEPMPSDADESEVDPETPAEVAPAQRHRAQVAARRADRVCASLSHLMGD